jgi:hypothetical protein
VCCSPKNIQRFAVGSSPAIRAARNCWNRRLRRWPTARDYRYRGLRLARGALHSILQIDSGGRNNESGTLRLGSATEKNQAHHHDSNQDRKNGNLFNFPPPMHRTFDGVPFRCRTQYRSRIMPPPADASRNVKGSRLLLPAPGTQGVCGGERRASFRLAASRWLTISSLCIGS